MNDEPLSGEEFRREWIRRRSADAHRRRNQRGRRRTDPYKNAQPVVIWRPGDEEETDE